MSLLVEPKKKEEPSSGDFLLRTDKILERMRLYGYRMTDISLLLGLNPHSTVLKAHLLNLDGSRMKLSELVTICDVLDLDIHDVIRSDGMTEEQVLEKCQGITGRIKGGGGREHG